MKKIAVMAIAFLLFIPFASINGNNVFLIKNTNGNILYVGGSGPNNYTSIQSAINDASNGYTIYVYPGNYNESIVMNKSISLIGIENNGEKPVISTSENKSTVIVEADGCIFRGFTMLSGRGLRIISNENIVENNRVMYSKGLGISLYGSSNNLIKNNEVTNGFNNGIHLRKSSDNIITRNIVSANSETGIVVFDHSDYNIISYNNVTKNFHGMEIGEDANDSTISFNHVYFNQQYGICVDTSNNVSILNNTIHNHAYGGLQLMDCSNCTVSGNEIYYNDRGIIMDGSYRMPWTKSHDNIISGNNVYSNSDIGMYLEDSRENYIIKNNFINNGMNAYFSLFIETDDPNPPRPIHNTWDNNYWSDWSLPTPKPIKGELEISIPLLGNYHGVNFHWFMFDKHPAMEPYGNFTYKNMADRVMQVKKIFIIHLFTSSLQENMHC